MRIPLLSILAVLAVAAPASASEVLQLQRGGRLVARDDPYLPPRQGPEAAGYRHAPAIPSAKVRAARGPTVKGAVGAPRRSGAISSSAAKSYYQAYNRARSARSHLGGQRRKELSAVLS